MLKHVVLLNWKPGTSQPKIDTVTAGLSALPERIPEIVSYQHGPDAGVYRGNADYALIAEFHSEADLKIYVNHPSHQAFLKDVAGPILESFQSVQFEVSLDC